MRVDALSKLLTSTGGAAVALVGLARLAPRKAELLRRLAEVEERERALLSDHAREAGREAVLREALRKAGVL